MLEKEFKFFRENHASLYAKYPNKYLVIKNEEVLFASDSFASSLDWAVQKGLIAGEYMVQLCSEGDSAYTQTFHSRAIF